MNLIKIIEKKIYNKKGLYSESKKIITYYPF
jgi:hypothetical protein